MSKRKTHEQYVEEVYNINPNIEVVDAYITNKTRIKHRCKIHNYEWYAKPSNILHGKGCPICGGSLKKTHEQYVSQITCLCPNIEVIGTYINAKTKIMHKCKIDGYKFIVTPNHILRGSGCPMCAGVIQKTTNQYKDEVFRINQNIEVIGEYVNAKTSIRHRCKIDDYEFDAKPNNILSGKGCPVCNQSHGEREIQHYLIIHFIRFLPQHTFDDCKNVFKLPFDFYLPDYNICIEYDGLQHFEPVDFFGGEEGFRKRQLNDEIKTKYCQENNIKLLRIRYDQDVTNILDMYLL